MKSPTLALLLACICSPASAANPFHTVADQMTMATIQVADAWARPTSKLAKTGVVYLTIVNHGATDDSLESVSTPAAATASLHISTMANGVSQMRALPSVSVKPGAEATFAPGGMHIMLENLTAPLTVGSSFPLTLHFAKAGDVTTQVSVQQKAGTEAAMPGMKM